MYAVVILKHVDSTIEIVGNRKKPKHQETIFPVSWAPDSFLDSWSVIFIGPVNKQFWA